MNSGGGYAFHAAWSSANIEQQQLQAQVPAAANGCSSHLSAACTSPSCNAKNIGAGAAGLLPVAAAKASWTVPEDLLYDHSSLLDCTRCINQGHLSRYAGEGHGQETINILDRELMLQDMQLNVDDDDDMGMEMKIMKKRKLTIEQARELEASFEADKKLEAEKKQRLADQLGLQPRQVAVWFQNRRARSKTKQLEIDFLTLKTEYDRVLAQRRKLQAEVARLTAQLQEKCSKNQNNPCSQDSTSSTNSNNGDVVSESTNVQTKKTSNDQGPTRDGEVLTSCNFGQDFGNRKEAIAKPQEYSKSPNLNAYDWEPYENGLWVFD